jgi:hypothetical protein
MVNIVSTINLLLGKCCIMVIASHKICCRANHGLVKAESREGSRSHISTQGAEVVPTNRLYFVFHYLKGTRSDVLATTARQTVE